MRKGASLEKMRCERLEIEVVRIEKASLRSSLVREMASFETNNVRFELEEKRC